MVCMHDCMPHVYTVQDPPERSEPAGTGEDQQGGGPVDPTMVRRLGAGECYVIAYGQAQKVAVAMLPLPEAMLAEGQCLVQAGGWFTYRRGPWPRPAGAAGTTGTPPVKPAPDPTVIDFE